MLQVLETAPGAKFPFGALAELKDSAWKPLSSYTHSGIHPWSRMVDGYPMELVIVNP